MNINFKRSLLVPFALCMLLAVSFSQKAKAQEYNDYNDNQAISTQTFYDDLAPYGQWVEDAQYGYVWVPNVDADFRPYYTNGYWVMTEYGNTWVSDYPWGWAAFHYGRWTYDNYYGWLWIPGTTWGPAWVSWRQNDNYYGWAPLGPGISVSASWGGGYYCPDTWWTFIPPQYIYRHNYYHYWYGPENNTTIIRNTTIINNTYVNNSTHSTYAIGPRATEIERHTSKPVTVYHLNSASGAKTTSISNGTVTMYHPMQVRTVTQYNTRPAPSIVAHAPQPISRSPQSPAVNGAAPAFHQQQAPQQQRTLPAVTTPARALQNDNQQRYEYNPQTAQPQRAAQQEREQPVQRQEVPQNYNRPQPQPQAVRPAPAMQPVQRSQPVAAPAPRPVMPPPQQAPRMQAPQQRVMPQAQPAGGR